MWGAVRERGAVNILRVQAHLRETFSLSREEEPRTGAGTGTGTGTSTGIGTSREEPGTGTGMGTGTSTGTSTGTGLEGFPEQPKEVADTEKGRLEAENSHAEPDSDLGSDSGNSGNLEDSGASGNAGDLEAIRSA